LGLPPIGLDVPPPVVTVGLCLNGFLISGLPCGPPPLIVLVGCLRGSGPPGPPPPPPDMASIAIEPARTVVKNSAVSIAPINLSNPFAKFSPPRFLINPRVASYALYPASIKLTNPFKSFPPISIIKSAAFPKNLTTGIIFGRCLINLTAKYPRRTLPIKFLIKSKIPILGADGSLYFTTTFCIWFCF
jgi:hypothetical protein